MPKFFNKKTATVRFHGFNEEKKYQNSKSDIIVSKRLIELIAVTLVLIFILIIRLAYVQLTQADTLEVKLETYGSTTYTNDAPRGEIYDRNYTKIMGNQNVICVDYYAPKKITDKEITYIAKFLSEKITIDFSKNNVNNITERNIKDYFIIAHEKLAESLLSDKELKKLKIENPDDADYSKAKTNLIVSKLSMEYIYQNMTQDEIEQTRFEYLMKRCKTGSVTLVEGVTVEEASVIGENTNILKGIQISSGWSRQSMVDGQLGALVGKLTTKRQGLPTELKTELLAKGYTGNSRVGTSGLEKQYEDILKASNSSYSVKYNSNGDPIITNNVNGEKGELDLLFVSPNVHSKGIGYAAWCEIEKMYPQVKLWGTVTPYFEQRNIHFYVNRCGFHIVEFFNKHHPDPNETDSMDEEIDSQFRDGMFRFEKRID